MSVSIDLAQQILRGKIITPKMIFPKNETPVISCLGREMLQITGFNCDLELLRLFRRRHVIVIPGFEFWASQFARRFLRCLFRQDVENIWYANKLSPVDPKFWYVWEGINRQSLDMGYVPIEELVKEISPVGMFNIPSASEIMYLIAVCQILKGAGFLMGMGIEVGKGFSFCTDVHEYPYHLHAGVFLPGVIDVRHYLGRSNSPLIGVAPVLRIPASFKT